MAGEISTNGRFTSSIGVSFRRAALDQIQLKKPEVIRSTGDTARSF